MARELMLPVAGTLAAIAITATMDATGYFAFSALPLFPLMLLFWWLDRLTRRELGFRLARSNDYAIPLLYPILVMGAIATIAAANGVLDTSDTDWGKAGLNVALVGVTTIIVAIVTEEGFFRGWLWGALQRRRFKPRSILMWTSLAFAGWHIAPISMSTGFDVPVNQIPVYLINA